MILKHGKRRGAVPALAVLAVVLFLIVLVATYVPEIRETIIEFLGIIFGR